MDVAAVDAPQQQPLDDRPEDESDDQRPEEQHKVGECRRHADVEDPVAKWDEIKREQQVLVDWLKGKDQVQLKGPNVDLTLSIAGRRFVNSHGLKNMPSGEIYTSPVEDSANGWVRFTYPAIAGGREVDDVSVRLESGRVVEATAKKNQEFLISTLDTDEGARTLGEFAIGTNEGIQRFTKSILYDEKIGGTIHMAFGRGFEEAGGTNESAVHWDMICDMRDGGKIWVDGELFYDSGEFAITVSGIDVVRENNLLLRKDRLLPPAVESSKNTEEIRVSNAHIKKE